jgi:hypothetical protein
MLDTLLLPHRLPATSTSHRLNGILQVEPGATLELANIAGPGCLRHLYFTLPPRHLRALTLRLYWDDEAVPSIECPLPDFFGVGHDQTTAEFSSLCFYVAPRYGYNCYLPMPFATRCRMTVTNEGPEKVLALYLMLAVHTYEPGTDVGPWRLHAAWRRVHPAYRRGACLTLAEAKGNGKVVGVIYHVCKRDSDDRWSHGGGDQFFIDGDTPRPAYVYGVGGEDFAHHAWGLYPGAGPYSGAHDIHPVPAVKRGEGPMPFEPHGWEQHDGARYSMYRFFIPDPITFRHSLRLTFGTCANEISATTYWYQTEPHTPFCHLPPPDQRGYSKRLTEESTWTPLPLAGDRPLAVLGPLRQGGQVPFDPTRPIDLAQVLESDLGQPFGDVVRPPWEIRWRRAELRGGFVDLAAIHRPKAGLRIRGLWNYRHLPRPTYSYQLLRLQLTAPRQVVLRVGFEDELAVWHNGRPVAQGSLPEPQLWATLDVPLQLAPGTHDLLIGNSQARLARWSTWGLYVQLVNPDGTLATDLAGVPFPQLDPTPERWREPWPDEPPVELPDYRDPLYLV